MSKAVSAKSTIPILSGIHLKATAAGVTLQTGSLDLMLQYELPAEEEHVIIHESGTIVVPAKYFIDIIRNSQDGIVTVEAKEGSLVVIRSGNAVYRLSSMNAEEFPQMVQVRQPDIKGLPNELLRAFIQQVSFARSTSEMRPVLTGVRCQFNEGHMQLLATDGIRLASRRTNDEDAFYPNPLTIIVPGKNLLQYAKLLNDMEAATDITIVDNKILLRTQNFTMQSLLIDGTYPYVDKLTSESFITVMTVDSAGFLHALERVSLLAGESSLVRMHIQSNGSIELLSQTAEIGDVVEEVPIKELLGDELTVYFNAAYMSEILRAADCAGLTLSFSGPCKPIIIRPLDDAASLYILTPIRSRL
ncbi:DNA polymerase III subunit beta [Paenibacillus baekrokdamisoli]|uniref:DNA polymerase III subunit beta n=1 Tax=Paenibacillus baekrokdamisoli TaxID=1712516 RepID=UPI0035D45FD5